MNQVFKSVCFANRQLECKLKVADSESDDGSSKPEVKQKDLFSGWKNAIKNKYI